MFCISINICNALSLSRNMADILKAKYLHYHSSDKLTIYIVWPCEVPAESGNAVAALLGCIRGRCKEEEDSNHLQTTRNTL